MKNTNLLIYCFTLFIVKLCVVDATINVCLPLQSTQAADISPENLFESIKNDIADELGEPIVTIDHIYLNISHPAVGLRGPLDNITIQNLLDFRICFLQNIFVNSSYYLFDVFNLTFPSLRLEGVYNLTGDLGDVFDVYGDGDFWVVLKNLSFSMVDFRFNLENHDLCLPVNINFALPEMENYLTNLMGGDPELEDVFNRVITSILPEALEIVWDELKDIFDKPWEDAINNILHNRNVFSVFSLLRSGEINSSRYCYENNYD